MHHPLHIHGADRLLILFRDGAEDPNLVWKDTVLIPAGQGHRHPPQKLESVPLLHRSAGRTCVGPPASRMVGPRSREVDSGVRRELRATAEQRHPPARGQAWSAKRSGCRAKWPAQASEQKK